MTDPAINYPTNGDLQQALVEAGYSISHDELDSEIYGVTTRRAVEDYQRRTGLSIDGVAGPQTWAALKRGAGSVFVAPGWRSDERNARASVVEVVRVAVGEIGQHEDPPGSNRGARIDVYARGHLGTPWCAWFASWCYRVAGAPFGTIGSAWGLYEWAKAHGRLVTAPLQPGDVAIIRRAGGHGHVGIVVADLGGGKIATVEGNSANAVRGRVRAVGDFTDYARPVA